MLKAKGKKEMKDAGYSEAIRAFTKLSNEFVRSGMQLPILYMAVGADDGMLGIRIDADKHVEIVVDTTPNKGLLLPAFIMAVGNMAEGNVVGRSVAYAAIDKGGDMETHFCEQSISATPVILHR